MAWNSVARISVVLMGLIAVGCSNPVGPTEDKPWGNPLKTPLEQPAPVPVPVPDGSRPPSLPRGTIQVTRTETPTEWRFVVYVEDADRAFEVEWPVGHHHDDRDAGAHDTRPGKVKVYAEGEMDYDVGQSASTTFIVLKRDVPCGASQVDADRRYFDGTKQPFLAEIVRAERDCLPPPNQGCLKSIGSRSVSGGTATFEIQPGGLVEISFVSYRLGATFLPQTFIAGKSGWFGPGVHTLTLPTDHPFQSDLYCGGYREEDLTEANFASYHARVIAYDFSGR